MKSTCKGCEHKRPERNAENTTNYNTKQAVSATKRVHIVHEIVRKLNYDQQL